MSRRAERATHLLQANNPDSGFLFDNDIRTRSAAVGPCMHSKPDVLLLISIKRRKYYHISALTKDNRE